MPGSLRFQHSLKTALGAVIAILLAMWFRWERPYWAGITVLVVMLPYLGAFLEKSLLRLTGTWLGALAGVLVMAAFAQSPLPFTIALAVLIIFFVYLAGSNYGVIMGVGTMVIIIFSGLEDPSRVWQVGAYRCAEVTLGILVGLFVNLSIWPRKASDALFDSSRDILLDLRAEFSGLADHFMEDKDIGGPGDIDLHRTGLMNRFSGMEVLLGYAVRESMEIRREKECYLSFILWVKKLFIALSELRQCLEGEIIKEYRAEFETELPIFADAVLNEMDQLIRTLEGRWLEEYSGYRERFLELRKRLDLLRRKKVPARYPLETSLRVLAFFNALSDITESLSGTRAALGRIMGRADALAPERIRPAHKTRGFKPDPARLKFAVKIAVGLLAAIYGWWYFRWPSGMQTVISFLVVVAQPHIAAANVKSISRLSGALIGCFLALISYVFILPYLNSVWWFGLLILVVIFISAFVNTGPRRYAYTGFQAGICFLLTVAQGYHQSFSIMPALNRTVGIMIGALLGAIVVRLIWPAVPRREFCRELERLFALFRETMAGVGETPPQPGISRAVSDNSPVLLVRCRQWLGQMRFFRPEERGKVKRLLPVLQVLSFRLLALFRSRDRLVGHPLLGGLDTVRIHLDREIEETFRRGRDVFRDEEVGEDIPGLAGVKEELDQELRRIRRDEESWRVPTEDMCLIGAMVVAYKNLVDEVENCTETIAALDLTAWDPEIPI